MKKKQVFFKIRNPRKKRMMANERMRNRATSVTNKRLHLFCSVCVLLDNKPQFKSRYRKHQERPKTLLPFILFLPFWESSIYERMLALNGCKQSMCLSKPNTSPNQTDQLAGRSVFTQSRLNKHKFWANI